MPWVAHPRRSIVARMGNIQEMECLRKTSDVTYKGATWIKQGAPTKDGRRSTRKVSDAEKVAKGGPSLDPRSSTTE